MRPELRPAPRYHPAAAICRSRPAKKYGIREGAPVAPWAASMRLPYLSLLGEDPLGQLGTEMMTSQLAESSYKTYGTGLRSFFAFCATEGVDILDATPQTIVRYLAWLCDRGTVAAGSLQPYLSSINRFLQDHLRAPVALGPLVVSAKKGYAHLQTALTPATPRTFLPPQVAYKILVSAERMCQNPDLASAPSGLSAFEPSCCCCSFAQLHLLCTCFHWRSGTDQRLCRYSFSHCFVQANSQGPSDRPCQSASHRAGSCFSCASCGRGFVRFSDCSSDLVVCGSSASASCSLGFAF